MMRLVVRTLLLVAAGGALCASIALANTPDPSKCTIGLGLTGGELASLRLTGRNTLTPGTPAIPAGNALGELLGGPIYTVEIHDFANNPVQGSSVVIDFSACSDVAISCDQTLFAGQTGLSGNKVAASTNAAGRCSFLVQGSINTQIQPGTAVLQNGVNCIPGGLNCSNPGCARIYADGILITGTALRVTGWDQNKSSGGGRAVTGSEPAILSAEFVRGQLAANGSVQKQRTDLNQDGVADGRDPPVAARAAVLPNALDYPVITGPYCP